MKNNKTLSFVDVFMKTKNASVLGYTIFKLIY